MPCYDPPPPWEGNKIKNAQEAAKILCGFAKIGISEGLNVPKEILEWFIEHRKIDLEISLSGWSSKSEDPNEIQASIDLAKEILKNAA